MLKKTREMLSKYKPGTYVPDDVECFDEAEIAEFGAVLASLVYAPSKLRKRLQDLGTTITRTDHYSEIPTIAYLESAFSRESQLYLDGIFKDDVFLKQFLQNLFAYAVEFDPPVDAVDEHSYGWRSGSIFSYSDAMAYYCMIRLFKPNTIIEIGCGSSTLIASMACEKNKKGKIFAIEPFPQKFLRTLPRVTLIETKVQDLCENFIQSNLDNGDFLFIDTTHTVKHDSDCLHIYLRILPHIRKNITVHAHDIFLPGTMSLRNMRDSQIFWNEQYLLYAYLIGNPRTKVLFGSAYHKEVNLTLLDQFMHGRYGSGGGSLWFSQDGR